MIIGFVAAIICAAAGMVFVIRTANILDWIDESQWELSPELVEAINHGIEDIKAGRTIPLEQVMEELKEEFGYKETSRLTMFAYRLWWKLEEYVRFPPKYT